MTGDKQHHMEIFQKTNFFKFLVIVGTKKPGLGTKLGTKKWGLGTKKNGLRILFQVLIFWSLGLFRVRLFWFQVRIFWCLVLFQVVFGAHYYEKFEEKLIFMGENEISVWCWWSSDMLKDKEIGHVNKRGNIFF
jgi:hypothetical protein